MREMYRCCSRQQLEKIERPGEITPIVLDKLHVSSQMEGGDANANGGDSSLLFGQFFLKTAWELAGTAPVSKCAQK